MSEDIAEIKRLVRDAEEAFLAYFNENSLRAGERYESFLPKFRALKEYVWLDEHQEWGKSDHPMNARVKPLYGLTWALRQCLGLGAAISPRQAGQLKDMFEQLKRSLE